MLPLLLIWNWQVQRGALKRDGKSVFGQPNRIAKAGSVDPDVSTLSSFEIKRTLSARTFLVDNQNFGKTGC